MRELRESGAAFSSRAVWVLRFCVALHPPPTPRDALPRDGAVRVRMRDVKEVHTGAHRRV